MITIVESGLTFGPYTPEQVFHIETSPTVKAMKGMKICEFILLTNSSPQTLHLIEAKSSIPNPHNNKEQYDSYFSELFEKFDNSLVISLFGVLGRFNEIHNAMPDAFKNIQWPCINLKLILVIPNVPSEFLPPLSEKLRSILTRHQKSWNMRSTNIVVLNEQLARKHNLIC